MLATSWNPSLEPSKTGKQRRTLFRLWKLWDHLRKSLLDTISSKLQISYDQRMKEKGKRSDAVGQLTGLVDPRLKAEAEALGKAITRFEVISKKLLQKYNKVTEIYVSWNSSNFRKLFTNNSMSNALLMLPSIFMPLPLHSVELPQVNFTLQLSKLRVSRHVSKDETKLW